MGEFGAADSVEGESRKMRTAFVWQGKRKLKPDTVGSSPDLSNAYAKRRDAT